MPPPLEELLAEFERERMDSEEEDERLLRELETYAPQARPRTFFEGPEMEQEQPTAETSAFKAYLAGIPHGAATTAGAIAAYKAFGRFGWPGKIIAPIAGAVIGGMTESLFENQLAATPGNVGDIVRSGQASRAEHPLAALAGEFTAELPVAATSLARLVAGYKTAGLAGKVFQQKFVTDQLKLAGMSAGIGGGLSATLQGGIGMYQGKDFFSSIDPWALAGDVAFAGVTPLSPMTKRERLNYVAELIKFTRQGILRNRPGATTKAYQLATKYTAMGGAPVTFPGGIPHIPGRRMGYGPRQQALSDQWVNEFGVNEEKVDAYMAAVVEPFAVNKQMDVETMLEQYPLRSAKPGEAMGAGVLSQSRAMEIGNAIHDEASAASSARIRDVEWKRLKDEGHRLLKEGKTAEAQTVFRQADERGEQIMAPYRERIRQLEAEEAKIEGEITPEEWAAPRGPRKGVSTLFQGEGGAEAKLSPADYASQKDLSEYLDQTEFGGEIEEGIYQIFMRHFEYENRVSGDFNPKAKAESAQAMLNMLRGNGEPKREDWSAFAEGFFTHDNADQASSESLFDLGYLSLGQAKKITKKEIAEILASNSEGTGAYPKRTAEELIRLYPDEIDRLATKFRTFAQKAFAEAAIDAAAKADKGLSTLFQGEGGVPPFYSKLARAAEAIQQKQFQNAQQVENVLTKAGVTNDEMRAMGLHEWLKENPKPTKSDLQQWANEGQLRVEFVDLRSQRVERNRLNKTLKEIEEAINVRATKENLRMEDLRYWDPNVPIGDMPAWIRGYAEKYQSIASEIRALKPLTIAFGNLTLPGERENYGEWFVTFKGELPADTRLTELVKENMDLLARYGVPLQDALNGNRSVLFYPIETGRHLRLIALDINRLQDEIAMKSSKWQDGHSEYKSIQDPIVRIRGDIRIDVDGMKLFVVEEMQPPVKGEFKKMPQWAQDNWRKIGAKYAMRLAAEGGADKIAWTTGKQQAERYSLRKYLDELQWDHNPDGSYGIIGRKNGEKVIGRERISANELSDLVGKEMSEKIIQGVGRDEKNPQWGRITGLDLEVGGEGLAELYDVHITREFEKLAKGKVGKSHIPMKREITVDGAVIGYEEFSPEGKRGEPIGVYAIDLTPDLRSKVLGEGYPLLQSIPSYKAAIDFKETGEAVMHALNGFDFSSLVHEMAHYFRRVMSPEDLAEAAAWAKVTPGESWTRSQEEAFARAFEGYLGNGQAPNPRMQSIFERFKEWLMAIYKGVSDSPLIEIDADIRKVFDKLLRGEPVTEVDISPFARKFVNPAIEAERSLRAFDPDRGERAVDALRASRGSDAAAREFADATKSKIFGSPATRFIPDAAREAMGFEKPLIGESLDQFTEYKMARNTIEATERRQEQIKDQISEKTQGLQAEYAKRVKKTNRAFDKQAATAARGQTVIGRMTEKFKSKGTLTAEDLADYVNTKAVRELVTTIRLSMEGAGDKLRGKQDRILRAERNATLRLAKRPMRDVKQLNELFERIERLEMGRYEQTLAANERRRAKALNRLEEQFGGKIRKMSEAEAARDLKSPMTMDQARTMVQNYENDPELGPLFRARHNAYMAADRQLIDAAYKGQLLTEESADNLANIESHEPRLFDQHIRHTLDPSFTLKTSNGKTMQVTDSGFPELEQGSIRALFADSEALFNMKVKRLFARIFRNRAQLELLEVADHSSNPDFLRRATEAEVEHIESGGGLNLPGDKALLSAMKAGKREWMVADQRWVEQWVQYDSAIQSDMATWISWLTGTRMVKYFATGINPLWAMRNLPRDFAHNWLSSEAWTDGPITSKLPILGMLQQTADYLAVMPDVFPSFGKALGLKPTGIKEKAIASGALMETFSAASRRAIHERIQMPELKAVANAMGYFNDATEDWGRLALFKRILDNLGAQKKSGAIDMTQEQIERAAARAARDVIDFSVVGGWTKALDSGIPYLAASIAGTRGLIEGAAKQGAPTFIWKLANLGAVTAGLYMANQRYHSESYNKIPDYERLNNFIIMLPFKRVDEDGEQHQLYVRIAKDQSQRPWSALIEALMRRYVEGEVPNMDWLNVIRGVQQAIPLMGGTDMLTPTGKALAGWAVNKDLWTLRDIWGGPNVRWKDEWNKYTSPTAVAIGQSTGLSPARLDYVGRTLFPSNVWTSIVSGAFAGMVEDLPEEVKAEMGNSASRLFKQIGGEFIRETRDTSLVKVVRTAREQLDAGYNSAAAHVRRAALRFREGYQKRDAGLMAETIETAKANARKWNGEALRLFEQLGIQDEEIPDEFKRRYTFQTEDVARQIRQAAMRQTSEQRAFGLKGEPIEGVDADELVRLAGLQDERRRGRRSRGRRNRQRRSELEIFGITE